MSWQLHQSIKWSPQNFGSSLPTAVLRQELQIQCGFCLKTIISAWWIFLVFLMACQTVWDIGALQCECHQQASNQHVTTHVYDTVVPILMLIFSSTADHMLWYSTVHVYNILYFLYPSQCSARDHRVHHEEHTPGNFTSCSH